MNLWQSLSHAASSLLYLLCPQVHSISITSLMPLCSSLFPLFHPSSLYPCFSLISVPMSPWSSHPLHIVFSPHSCFLCFMPVPFFFFFIIILFDHRQCLWWLLFGFYLWCAWAFPLSPWVSWLPALSRWWLHQWRAPPHQPTSLGDVCHPMLLVR